MGYPHWVAKVIMPLREDLLLRYMLFDTLIGKPELQYAIRNGDGLIGQHVRNIHKDSAYHAARFPFTKIAFRDRLKKLYLCALNFDLWLIRLT